MPITIVVIVNPKNGDSGAQILFSKQTTEMITLFCYVSDICVVGRGKKRVGRCRTILGQQLSKRQMNAVMSDCMQGTCCIRKISPDVRRCGKETKGATQGLELQTDRTVSLQKQKKITCVQMANIAKSLELYKLDNSTYPKNIKSLIEKGYIKKEATDPWGKKIIYVKLKDGFELISLGKDGIESSDDIKYSECK